ncbi:tRNA (guanosine(37)-N1)-methyltransferase TrmD [Naumannella halotolerans]|uniref:tRNA (guanosine(37)-N1)-methyltransferase TrmD n=1 Tax=Naumannella halotolerans TaxID=993414 RepID=UPI00370D916D
MRIDVVSIFPEYLAPLRMSLLGKAMTDGIIDFATHDLRDFTHDRHRTVDAPPYGGGAGMVMKPEPWGEALDHLRGAGDGSRPTLLVPTPAGHRFSQAMARDLARRDWLIFACGRYEGIDQRVIDDAAGWAEVIPFSLGDYVLNGGEVASMAVIEAVGRLIPGVVGNPESLVEESHSDGLLEYPSYTKPRVWRDREVPEILLSGDHAKIAAWRAEQSRRRTAATRPDLLHSSQVLAPDDLAEGSLRPAVAGDLAELFTLTKACWVPEALINDRLDIPPLHETLEQAAADLQTWTTLVLRSGGRLVGSVRGRADGTSYEVGRLMVAPDLRGRGLGRWLLERIEEQAPEGTERFWLFTGERSTHNLKLYRKAGYRLDRSIPTPDGAVALAKRATGR